MGKRCPLEKTKFLKFLRECGNVSKAAEAAGTNRRRVYEWRAEDPEFASAWADAKQQAADVLEAEAWRRAVKGVEKPIFRQGSLVGYEQVYSDTLLIFLAKGARPEKYRERVSQEVSGPKDKPLQKQLDLSLLTQSELEQLESLLKRATPTHKALT